MIDGTTVGGRGNESQPNAPESRATPPETAEHDYHGVRQSTPLGMPETVRADVLDELVEPPAADADEGATGTADDTDYTADHYAGVREPVPVDMADAMPTDLLDAQDDDTDDTTPTLVTDGGRDVAGYDCRCAACGSGEWFVVAQDNATPCRECGEGTLIEALPVYHDTPDDEQDDDHTDDGAHPMTESQTEADDDSTDTTTTGRLMTDGGQPDPDEWTPQQDASDYGGVRHPTKMNWIDAVRAGFHTAADAAEAMGRGRSTASKNLNPLAERDDAPLVAYRDGHTKVYEYDTDVLPDDNTGGTSGGSSSDDADGDAPDAADGTDPALAAGFPKPLDDYHASMPDYRHNFDFDAQVPEGVPEYHPSGDEMEALNDYANVLEQVDGGDAISSPLALQLVGPTGAGKTHAPKKVADTRDWAYYEITMADSMDPGELEGVPTVMSDFVAWNDAKLVEALLSTHDRPTVLLLDEVNRAPPAVRSVFMSVLDSRASITLSSRGGEEVTADKSNLLVVSTRNPADNPDYDVYDLDRAQESRLGRRCSISYLGMGNPGREATLLVDQQGVSDAWAEGAVAAANEVREAANESAAGGGAFGGGGGGGGGGSVSDAASHIDRGVPTRNLLNMARDAYLSGQAGRPDASMKAIRGHLENDYDGEALDIVETKFADEVAGVDPVGDNGNGLLDGNGGGA